MVSISADSAVLQAGGVGYRVFCGPGTLVRAEGGPERPTLDPSPGPRGPAGALWLRDDRGARLLRAADDRDRGRAEGRAHDRVVATRGRSSAGHLPGRRGRADRGVGRRQEARRADHPRAQGEGVGRRSVGWRCGPGRIGGIGSRRRAAGPWLHRVGGSRVGFGGALRAPRRIDRSRIGSRPRCASFAGTKIRRAGSHVMLVAVVVLAIIFDYINGFHDTANAIATSVATVPSSRAPRSSWRPRSTSSARSPGTAVAKTIGGGLVDERRPRPGRRRRGARRRDHLEPDHLVLRPAQLEQSRADRRPARRHARRCRRPSAFKCRASSTRS